MRQVREALMRGTLTLVGPHPRQHRQAFSLLALDGADFGLLSLLRLDRRADGSQPLQPPPRRPSVLACLLTGRWGCMIHCLVIGHPARLPDLALPLGAPAELAQPALTGSS
jgi:hypothetical protein